MISWSLLVVRGWDRLVQANSHPRGELGTCLACAVWPRDWDVSAVVSLAQFEPQLLKFNTSLSELGPSDCSPWASGCLGTRTSPRLALPGPQAACSGCGGGLSRGRRQGLGSSCPLASPSALEQTWPRSGALEFCSVSPGSPGHPSPRLKGVGVEGTRGRAELIIFMEGPSGCTKTHSSPTLCSQVHTQKPALLDRP